MTGSKAWRGTAKLGCNGCHGYGAGEFLRLQESPTTKVPQAKRTATRNIPSTPAWPTPAAAPTATGRLWTQD